MPPSALAQTHTSDDGLRVGALSTHSRDKDQQCLTLLSPPREDRPRRGSARVRAHRRELSDSRLGRPQGYSAGARRRPKRHLDMDRAAMCHPWP